MSDIKKWISLLNESTHVAEGPADEPVEPDLDADDKRWDDELEGTDDQQDANPAEKRKRSLRATRDFNRGRKSDMMREQGVAEGEVHSGDLYSVVIDYFNGGKGYSKAMALRKKAESGMDVNQLASLLNDFSMKKWGSKLSHSDAIDAVKNIVYPHQFESKVNEGIDALIWGASNLNKSFIVTAKTAEGPTKKYRVRAQSERVAREKFAKHASMAEILKVEEEPTKEGMTVGTKYHRNEGVAEGSEYQEPKLGTVKANLMLSKNPTVQVQVFKHNTLRGDSYWVTTEVKKFKTMDQAQAYIDRINKKGVSEGSEEKTPKYYEKLAQKHTDDGRKGTGANMDYASKMADRARQAAAILKQGGSQADAWIHYQGTGMAEGEKIDEAHSLKLDVHDDHEVSMAQADLYKMARYATELHNMLDSMTNLEGWVQAKITLASDYISTVKHYLEYELDQEREKKDELDLTLSGARAKPMPIIDEAADEDMDDSLDSDEDADKDKVPHIVMQLRKALDVDGDYPIKFEDGKSYKLPMAMIHKFLNKHDSAKPEAKNSMSQAAIKSIEGFKSQI